MKTINHAVNPNRIDPFVDWGFKYIFGREAAFVETAKALKAEGIDLSVISKCTGLSVDVIRNL